MPIAVQPITAAEVHHVVNAKKSTAKDKTLQLVPTQAEFDPILLSLL
jgi:hypothetical protein